MRPAFQWRVNTSAFDRNDDELKAAALQLVADAVLEEADDDRLEVHVADSAQRHSLHRGSDAQSRLPGLIASPAHMARLRVKSLEAAATFSSIMEPDGVHYGSQSIIGQVLLRNEDRAERWYGHFCAASKLLRPFVGTAWLGDRRSTSPPGTFRFDRTGRDRSPAVRHPAWAVLLPPPLAKLAVDAGLESVMSPYRIDEIPYGDDGSGLVVRLTKSPYDFDVGIEMAWFEFLRSTLPLEVTQR